ncbi:MDR family MFS transporter [Streptomyces sp. NPDC096033]|uniref:MDR family MFS transporter n=1 Tax=Streptomyces sp. NPDC096033 TaxID=3366071 RepID=UPI0037FBCFFE
MNGTAGSRLRAPAAVRGLPAAFWWIWLSVLVNWIGGFAGPMLALSLTAGRGWSASYAGLFLSLVGIGGILGTFLGGALADRIGRRTTMFAAHLWTAVSISLLGVSGEPWAVAASALAVGLGATAVRPAMQASLTDLVPPQDRRRAFALNYWALNAGGAIAAVLAGLMVVHGYALIFLADGVTTLLCGLLVLAKVPETRPDPTARPAAPAEPKPGPVHRDGPFMLFVLMTALFAVVFKQGTSTLPVVMTREGHSPAMYSLVSAANGLLVVALQIPLTRLVGGRSRPMVLLVAGLLLGWGFGLTVLADSVAAYASTVLVWTLGEILQAPAGIAVTADRAPADMRGRYQGMYGGAWSAAAFVAPAGGGWVLDHWGATTLWTLCAVLATTAGAGCALVTARAKDFHTGRPGPVWDGNGTPPVPPASSGPGRGTPTEGNAS